MSRLGVIRHKRGYKGYARNDRTLPHKAVASWKGLVGSPGQPSVEVWYCVCGWPVEGVKEPA